MLANHEAWRQCSDVSPIDATAWEISVAILDVVPQLDKHGGHVRPRRQPQRVNYKQDALLVSCQDQYMFVCLTIRIGEGPRIEGLILTDGVDKGRFISRVVLESHWHQGEHEMLQMVEEGGAGSLAQVSHRAIWVTEHAAIGRLAIIRTQDPRVRSGPSRRRRRRVAAIELAEHVCGAVWCCQLEAFLECSTALSQAVDFTFESAFVRFRRGVLA
jgi:hypothetical protein